jgi:glycosyltransferase involved in cell wall biosynthesis
VPFDPQDRGRIHVLSQKTNTGSAGGYNIGLRYAQNLAQIDYVILLDDDLLIEEKTVHALSLYIEDNPHCDAVIVPRDDRPDQSASLQAGRAPVIHSNSFHDFHILDWRRSLKRPKPNASSSRMASDAVPVDYAPYAGMVLSSALVRRAELPDRKFYVYCDDYDYLMKLKIAGAHPVLIGAPPLKSIDQSWNQKSGRAPALFNKTAPSFRIYYSLRNRVTYEKRYIVNSYLMYIINMMAFLTAGSLISLSEGGVHLQRLRLLATAIKDGWRDNLGRNDETVRRYS